jgi:hypothetical protein
MIKGRERQGKQGKKREKRERKTRNRRDRNVKNQKRKQIRAMVNWKPVDTREATEINKVTR